MVRKYILYFLGKLLVAKILAHLNDGKRNIYLNAEVNAIKFYSKYGLQRESWRTQQYVGFPEIKHISDSILGVTFSNPGTCLGLLPDILEYDATMHPTCDRADYWSMLGKYPEVTCVTAKRAGKVVGFGCMEPLYVDYRIKPLYADDVEVAKCLFKKLYQSIPITDNQLHSDAKSTLGKPYLYIDYIEVSDRKPFFNEVCKMTLLEPYNRRLYLLSEPKLLLDKAYCFANFDLHMI